MDKAMIVYVVSIPWDSYLVGETIVFESKEKADYFAKITNERGYNGYLGGVEVRECHVVRGAM